MRISTHLKTAAANIARGNGRFYSALPDGYDLQPDDFLDELFGVDPVGVSPLSDEPRDVRVLGMCFAAAVAAAEGK